VDQDGLLFTSDTNITKYGWNARNRLTEVLHYADYAFLGGNSPDRESKQIAENVPQSGLQAATRLHEAGIALVHVPTISPPPIRPAITGPNRIGSGVFDFGWIRKRIRTIFPPGSAAPLTFPA
jgi:hypothetical protein